MCKKLIYLSCFVLVLAATVGTAEAVTNFTNARGDNNFNDAGNWDNGVPASGNDGIIANGLTAIHSDGAAVITGTAMVTIGANGTAGTLNIISGSLETTNGTAGYRVGMGAGSVGTLNIYDGARLSVLGAGADLFIGDLDGGYGVVNVFDGGELQTRKALEIINSKIFYSAYSLNTNLVRDELVVDNGGTLAFEIDNDTVATIPGSTLIVELGSNSTLELILKGDYSVGDSWILITGISTFTGVDGSDGTGVFGNVVSPQGFKFRIDYNAVNGELIATLTSTDVPIATQPSPADEETDVPYKVVLSWTPGKFVEGLSPKHKVFLSDNFDDVNDGVAAIVTQDANSYDAGRLDFDKTYYWRVDEANSVTGWDQGDVWQFTVEPIAYPIPAEKITVTTFSQAENQGPENTVNGSGLDVNDLHSTEPTDMWLSGSGEPGSVWIEYELDKVYKLHEIWVWNSNQMMEPAIGLGFKDVSIEYSVNGTDYTTLGTTHEFTQGTGAADYANTAVDLSGVAAKHVRLTANSNWGGGMLDQYGLSEVRFFSIPVYAREPNPDSEATDVDVDVTLGFRAGRDADTHDVYLSTDEQAVIDGNTPVSTVTEASYGPLSLDLGTTYYWKINEVNEAETPTTWQGEIWSFSTPEFFIVDGFEDYNDWPPDEIWFTWVDGYGVPANGATAGYPAPDFLAGEHYVETTIVHGGEQAMPFFYDNTGTAAYSEGERTFAVPQDWTAAGVQTLALYFHGTAGNTGQLYVKVNGSKVVYDGDASNLARAGWQAWNIDLASFGVSLQSVTTLAIGIDGSGASGTLYFDDIRLYPYSRQFVTPAEPNNAGLIGHWKFDGDTLDYSGLGNDGTAGGDPTFVVGKVGSGAIDLDGIGDYVEIDGVADDITTNIFTLTAWIKTTQTVEGSLFASNDSGSGHDLQFGVKGGNAWVDDGSETQFPPAVNDDQWYFVAYVRDGATAYIYVDGALRGTDSATGDPASETRWSIGQEWDPPNPSDEFEGMVDDVRFYNYALSLGEVAWLAGLTEPFDKPF